MKERIQKNLNLKYDWNNLFLACAHCNNMKSAKYEPILDCSKIDVDRMEATNIRRILRKDLSDFKNLIRDYEEAEEYEREDYIAAIRKEVSAGAPFAAFKRWILWDNGEKYRACGL
ncbi:MAG: HNH endonuclease [Lachnospiraceae bacterium]|nr:HNH endonuclease [Lachnospiraceae bacterium]